MGSHSQQTFIYSTAEEIIDAAKSIMESMMVQRDAFTNPNIVKDYLRARIGNLEHEVFTVMFLDNQNRLIKAEDMFRGTIDGAGVYPREVAKAALKNNASALVIAHNHPCGLLEPSAADQRITQRLIVAMELLDVRILDHVIVSAEGAMSFAERGLM